MYIILSILAIILLLLLVAAVMPKRMEIEVSTTIKAPKATVWEYVKILANQTKYSVWVMKDPNVKLTYNGIDGTVGARQARESNDKNVGKGEQEIMKLEEGKQLDMELRFEKPMKATNYAKTMLADMGDATTKVTNMFRGDTPWPFNIMSPIIGPGLKKDMQQNMDNLKKELEK
ncbi:MAG: hypothetical protein RL023_824 [Candidatus Parcubacteria bacterium]|jgi:uncharacterized protein YndB with AHSA1/START domain